MRPIVVFDAYGTLWGAVVGDWAAVRLRPHAIEVLQQLARGYDLALWTTASRSNFGYLLRQFPDLAAVFSRIVTRDDVPTDAQSYLPERQQEGRISKNIRLIGGDVLVDDADDAIAEAQAFGFRLIRAPSILFESADQLAQLDGDDWMLQLPRLIEEALADGP